MNVSWHHPAVTDDIQVPRAQLDDFVTVVVFESIIKGKPVPGDSVRVRLLVNQQTAFAAVGFERIVLARDDLHLSISIQICNRAGMWRRDLVDPANHCPPSACRSFVYPLHHLNTSAKKTGHLVTRQPVHGKFVYWMVRVNVVEAVMFELLLSVAVTVTV
jgi:hypothetical protein